MITHAGTVALLGRPNVGKSTLLNALLGERIAITSPHPQTTRDRIAGITSFEGAQLVFLDTPGFHAARNKLGERMNELARGAADECDVAVFMTDSTAPSPRDDDRAILGAVPPNKPTVLAINKVDRVKPRALLFPALEAWAKARDFAAIVPIAAKNGDGVERLLREVATLVRALGPSAPLFAEDELTDKPLRFLVAELVREQILHRTRQEVPHGVAVTVEAFDEGAKAARIAVTVHVAKDSHKGILIGDGGKMLAAIGTAARKRAEGLLGKRVHLETWVRATPKWFDDAARLSELGYGGGSGERAARATNAKSAKSAKKKRKRHA